MNSSEVDNNTASHTSGGGIVNHGTMTLNKTEVNGNTAAGSGVVASGGGIISAQGPPGSVPTTLTLNNSKVNNNRAGGDGGGIANGVPLPGPMPLIGGALTLNHSQVTGNTAAHGGGIFNNGGTVTLAATSVTGNHPGQLRAPGHHRRLHRLIIRPARTPAILDSASGPEPASRSTVHRSARSHRDATPGEVWLTRHVTARTAVPTVPETCAVFGPARDRLANA